MLKLKIEGKETWAFCPEAVKKFAADTFKENDEVDITSESKSDGLHVSRIAKKGQGGTPAPAASTGTQSAPPAASTPAASGTSAKGTSTGSLNMPTKYRDPLSPDEARIVRRQSMMAAACQAVSSVTGQIDPNALPDYVINLFNRLLAEVEK